MPPALSDEENGASSGDEIPFRGPNAAPQEELVEEEEDEEDGVSAPDEYVVEKIMSHRFTKEGEIEYNVKWAGYEKKSDRTWEPEDNLETAMAILNEYFEEIGGRPEPGDTKGKKRKGRKSIAADAEAESAPKIVKRAKKEKEWSPPPGSWELDVDFVDTVEETVDAKTGALTRYAYLVWTNAKKTQHPLTHVYHKCPQKMLKYYESHLVFTHNTDENGDQDDKDTSMKSDV
ncbi:hypothetical protein K504DRAFT_462414 [Pleomassaria siparia CBS 279.74]|uniref:Chromo domain-containing protein n=1 Tax=Pleomassaria siparia CBS 279.74 TaxID=1314801 RepID=A0A6G1KNH7_9PLEO|nr:hypothetical protein K504DRAFT_462414 [Pleomassaria siparia CBS 279.74]